MIDYSSSRIGITDGTTVLSADGEGNGRTTTSRCHLSPPPKPTARHSIPACVPSSTAYVPGNQQPSSYAAALALARVLCSEHIRLNHRIPTIVVDGPSSIRARRAVNEQDCASTLILSGRADAVAFEPEPNATNGVAAHAEAAR